MHPIVLDLTAGSPLAGTWAANTWDGADLTRADGSVVRLDMSDDVLNVRFLDAHGVCHWSSSFSTGVPVAAIQAFLSALPECARKVG